MNTRIRFINVCWILASICFTGWANASFKIVGGDEVASGKYPFIALLWFDDDSDGFAEPFCSGSHIGDRWILTAAHCFTDSNFADANRPEDLAVLLGAIDITADDLEFLSADRVIIHPEYNPSNRTADIALVRLTEAPESTPISLPDSSYQWPTISSSVTAAGWGRTSESEGSNSANLLEVELEARSHVVCHAVFGSAIDNNAVFCAGGDPDGLRDTCAGDSGGAVFQFHNDTVVQVGIVNFGIGCARPGIPALYTRTSHYFNWLTSQVDFPLVAHLTDTMGVSDPDYPVLTGATVEAGNVRVGEDDVYDVSGMEKVTLTSLSGDADLYIFAGENFTTSTFLCQSLLAIDQSMVDECAITNTGQRVFATVYGFTASDYRLVGEQSSSGSPSNGPSNSGGSGGGALHVVLLLALLLANSLVHRNELKRNV
ncbi:MAG: serine protease [Gammaproteobacteria bacterium]|nr:serine protease [Gammaproteobacteria bacterium]